MTFEARLRMIATISSYCYAHKIDLLLIATGCHQSLFTHEYRCFNAEANAVLSCTYRLHQWLVLLEGLSKSQFV